MDEIKVINCAICKLPLGDFEIANNHKWHSECKKCHYCQNEVHSDQIIKMVHTNEGRMSTSLVFHEPCRDRAMAESLKKQPVTITQELLDYYNELNLLFAPQMDVSPFTNMQIASNMGDVFFKSWIINKTPEEQMMHLKRIEAVAVAWSILIDKKKAQKSMDEHEVRRIHTERTGQAVKDKEIKVKKAQTDLIKMDPAERAKHKAIQAAIAMGLSEEQARNFVCGTGGVKQ